MNVRSILVADDMLDASQPALDAAVLLAKLFQAKLTVVTVISMVSPGFGIPVPMGDTLGAIMDQAEKRLAAQKERIAKDGVRDVHVQLLEGDPVDQVVEFARVHRPDLIVVGSRGLGGAGRFLLGSVSDGILHHVHCSVLVVKSEPAKDPKPS